jgi:anti-anti-sigma factor
MEMHHVLYAVQEKKFFIQLIGDIRYHVSNLLDVVINQSCNFNEIERIFVDLRETLFIDSTNLGLLAKIVKKSQEYKLKKPALISTNEDVNIILRSMSFDDVFEFLECPPNDFSELHFIEISGVDEQPSIHLYFDAHKTLMEMNENNYQEFSEVVRLFEHDLNCSK